MSSPLPPIPAKRYFTIGEVAELCNVKPHVLRYWEQEFAQLRPMKRRGNRRYYQHHEVLMIRRIRELLYGQGFTINGARSRLQDSNSAHDFVELEAFTEVSSALAAARTAAAHPVPPVASSSELPVTFAPQPASPTAATPVQPLAVQPPTSQVQPARAQQLQQATALAAAPQASPVGSPLAAQGSAQTLAAIKIELIAIKNLLFVK